MIGQKLRPVSRKMWQFYLNMNIEGTLWRHAVIGDVIIIKIILVDDFHTIFLYLLSNWGHIENSVTGSKVCYLDSQSNFLHFELLIDVVARKLTESWQFQNLTYFLTLWPSYLTYIPVQRTCRTHGLVLACDDWLSRYEILWNFRTNRQTDKHDQPAYLPKW